MTDGQGVYRVWRCFVNTRAEGGISSLHRMLCNLKHLFPELPHNFGLWLTQITEIVESKTVDMGHNCTRFPMCPQTLRISLTVDSDRFVRIPEHWCITTQRSTSFEVGEG